MVCSSFVKSILFPSLGLLGVFCVREKAFINSPWQCPFKLLSELIPLWNMKWAPHWNMPPSVKITWHMKTWHTHDKLPVQLTALAAYHARIMFPHCRRFLCLLSPCLKGFLLRDYPWVEGETATSLSQVWVIWLVGTLGSRVTNDQCSVSNSSVLNKSVLVASGYCDQRWGNAHREMFPQMR